MIKNPTQLSFINVQVKRNFHINVLTFKIIISYLKQISAVYVPGDFIYINMYQCNFVKYHLWNKIGHQVWKNIWTNSFQLCVINSKVSKAMVLSILFMTPVVELATDTHSISWVVLISNLWTSLYIITSDMINIGEVVKCSQSISIDVRLAVTQLYKADHVQKMNVLGLY